MDNRLDKNARIADTQRATYEKRKSQVCRVFQIKIQSNKLTVNQREELKMLFVEGKWCHNAILASPSVSGYDTKPKSVVHKDKDGNDIETEYRYLPQSVRQTIKKQIQDNLRVLSTRKKRGYKVGPLKFISELTSINFKQYGVTHKILSRNQIKLQGIKGCLKVNGLDQIYGNPDYEMANWKLLNLPDGYYVNITTYIDKDKVEKKKKIDKILGIDFGCRTSFTTSEDEHLSFKVQEGERLKHLQRKLSRQKKGSKRYERTKHLMRVEYQKIKNQKKDLANKTVAHFVLYDKVVFQDEMLPLWHKSHFGKTVQHNILGRVKAELMKKDNVIVLSRSLPTTKFCPGCGKINHVKLCDESYKCSCGVYEDRDYHAAKNMVWFYENNVGVGRTKFKRVEIHEAIDKAFADSVAIGSVKREADTL